MSKAAKNNNLEAPQITAATEADKQKIVASNAPPKSVIRDYAESFAVTFIMAFFGMTFIIQAVTVPTGSMQNTINIGDHILVNKFIYSPGPPLPFLPMRDIERGDIVVFKYPGNPNRPEENGKPGYVPYQTNYVKRVIGMPGETIEFRENQVFINGKLLPENRQITDNPGPENDPPIVTREFEPKNPDAKYTVYYDAEGMAEAEKGLLNEAAYYAFGVAGKTMKIPENNYFMMGDNRDNSGDSRVWGFVPRELVVGRPMFIYWSCDYSNDKNKSFTTCLTHPRLNRIGTMVK